MQKDALTLSVDFNVQGPNGEKKTMNADFDVVKINNKWYAITDMADQKECGRRSSCIYGYI